MYIYIHYTGVDPKQNFGNKEKEQQASLGAREPRTCDPRTGDPGTVRGYLGLYRDTLESIGILGNFEGEHTICSSLYRNTLGSIGIAWDL